MIPNRPLRAHAGASCRRATRQHGSGAAGFLLAAVPVLWLGLGGVELAYWMHLRQSLSLILMDTARTGATQHAEPTAMATAFERGLHQIYPADGEVARVLQQRRSALGTPWHIRVLQPVRAAFADHADPRPHEPRAWPGQPLIRNDVQYLQHASRIAQGWPQGRGPTSGSTVFEANTLTLALHWPHKPLLPGLGALMRTLAPLAADAQNRVWMASGHLPFRRQVAVAMHSSPALWDDLPDGRITHGPGPSIPPNAGQSPSGGLVGEAPATGPMPSGTAPGGSQTDAAIDESAAEGSQEMPADPLSGPDAGPTADVEPCE